MVSQYIQDAIAGEELPSSLVPQEMCANLEFRMELLRKCALSEKLRQDVMKACARDLFFFIDAFVWVSDVKRYPNNSDRPFITWPFQREVLADIDASIGRKSVGIIKSRDLGGSTMPLLVFDRRLLFFRNQTLMVMSRNEKWVDDPRNPDSLFFKLDYLHRWLPSWMTNSLTRLSMTLVNTALHSNIIGSSATGDAARGGRKQAILVDEFAAWDRKDSLELLASIQHATSCRIFNSTPKGIGNGFHQIMTQGNITVHKLHWSMHPVHGAGLYTTENGHLKILDDDFWNTTTSREILDKYPELEKKLALSDELAKPHYKFQLDGKSGKLRSPYYDLQCLLCPIPKLIDQELDMDWIGSGSPFFDIDELRDYVRIFARKPLHIGEVTWDEEFDKFDDVKWVESAEGRLHLWFHPDTNGKPIVGRRYIIGCDISTGKGVSNSVLSVGDCVTRSKVATLVTKSMGEVAFANYVYAVAKHFNGAKIIFEGSGPGVPFGRRLMDLKGARLYHMKGSTGNKKPDPGFFLNGDLKRSLLVEYGRALTMREYTNPDEAAIDECQMYQFTENQLVVHVASIAAADPSGAKGNHGDRVIADALLWMLLRKEQRTEAPDINSQNSFAYMQQQEERIEARQGSWSPVDIPQPWALISRRVRR